MAYYGRRTTPGVPEQHMEELHRSTVSELHTTYVRAELSIGQAYTPSILHVSDASRALISNAR
jgi:hypothetical protein